MKRRDFIKAASVSVLAISQSLSVLGKKAAWSRTKQYAYFKSVLPLLKSDKISNLELEELRLRLLAADDDIFVHYAIECMMASPNSSRFLEDHANCPLIVARAEEIMKTSPNLKRRHV